jgi:hypothetical protein
MQKIGGSWVEESRRLHDREINLHSSFNIVEVIMRPVVMDWICSAHFRKQLLIKWGK